MLRRLHDLHRSAAPWLAFALVAASAMSALTTSTGCDDGDGGSGAGDPCATEIGADGCFQQDCVGDLPASVSFEADVLPIFEQSCGLSSSCHGNPSSPTTPSGYQPYLGEVDPDITPSDIDLIFSTNVDQPSPVSSMKIVDPGKPESSFLMHKMDGDVDCPDLGCMNDECGDTMPQGSTPLPRETRDTVRAWIQQGAQKN